jgi:hypothetical protein
MKLGPKKNNTMKKINQRTEHEQNLLEEWIVVMLQHSDDNDRIKVTKRSNFEEIDYCKTYSNYGQKVGCNCAGCYSFANEYSEIHSDFVSAVEKISDIVELNKFSETWKSKHESHTQVTAWTFHDSHNFKTYILEPDFSDPDFIEADCIELEEEEQLKILRQMPKSAPHIERVSESIKTNDFLFTFDLWATNPWFCYVEKL